MGRTGGVRRRLAGMACLLAALGSMTGALLADSEVADILSELAEKRPDRLVALEQVLGPLERDREDSEEAGFRLERWRDSGPIARVSVSFLVDWYHQDPARTEDLRLRQWKISFRGDSAEAQEILDRAVGQVDTLDFSSPVTHRYGRFFLTPDSEATFSLAWYREEPTWAVSKRSKEQTERAERVLVDLIGGRIDERRLREVFPGLWTEEGECATTELPRWRVKVCPAASRTPRRIRIEVRGEPLPVDRLMRSLGWRDPGVAARDVHLTSRDVIDLESMSAPLVAGYELGAWWDESTFERVEPPGNSRANLYWRPTRWLLRVLFLKLPREERR